MDACTSDAYGYEWGAHWAAVMEMDCDSMPTEEGKACISDAYGYEWGVQWRAVMETHRGGCESPGYTANKDATYEEPAQEAPLWKGVGGVVELLRTKYACNKGDRYLVVGETSNAPELWLLDDGVRVVPKVHENKGWAWVAGDAQVMRLGD